MSVRTLPPRLLGLIVGVSIGALVVLALSVPAQLVLRWPHLMAWTLICVLSDTLWTRTDAGTATWSLSSTAAIASVVLWGGAPAIWIVMVSTCVSDRFVLKKDWIRVWYNTCQITLTMWAGSQAFGWMGGPADGIQALIGTPTMEIITPVLVGPLVALIAVYFLVNRALVSAAAALATGRRYLDVFRSDWLAPQRLFMDSAAFLLAPLMVISYAAIGYPGVVLLYAPLLMIHESDKRFTELKHFQELRLKEQELVVKGEMAAKIGHNLSNKLVAIKGRSQMMQMDGVIRSSERAMHHLAVILEQADAMAKLAERLVNYRRHLRLELEPTDMNGLVRSTIEHLSTNQRTHGIEFDLDLDRRLPQIRVDAGQVQEVFENLFLNAADAMVDQSTRRAIAVSTRYDDAAHAARIEVQDTGPGIKPEHLSRMFELMFTTKPDGHGFGLPGSLRTIQSHEGQISVESPPGSGAKFTIVLPIRGPRASR